MPRATANTDPKQHTQRDLLLMDRATSARLYQHQLRQTIDAYNPTQLLFGEALQNALDAVIESGGGTHQIRIELDFDKRTVLVRDDGTGFPNNPDLLFLGGTLKARNPRKLAGLVGVGLKVVLFSSKHFRLRSRSVDGTLRLVLNNAYRFDSPRPPTLRVSARMPDDPHPLAEVGTELSYELAETTPEKDPFLGFARELRERCFPREWEEVGVRKLLTAIANGRAKGPSPFARVLELFVRRFSYAGNVLLQLDERPELAATKVTIAVTCAEPQKVFGEEIAKGFEGNTTVVSEFVPSYLLVNDTVNWLTSAQKHPPVFHHALGLGGQGLSRMASGFNQLTLRNDAEYSRLLLQRNGKYDRSLEEYQRRLFPHLNGVILTIGRIPQLEEFLPGGSRRVISANGVITTHDMEIIRGLNQQYVRCVDIVVDVNAELNYGKSQLKNTHLVRLIRDYVNDAYKSTLQHAAEQWVGKLQPPGGSDSGDNIDAFVRRTELGVEWLASRKVPKTDDDVISLFFELLGREVLDGFRFYGFSDIDQYMSRARIRRKGQSNFPPEPEDDRQLSPVEFLVHASGIVSSLEGATKSAQDLALVVAWDEGKAESANFVFADAEYMHKHVARIPGVQRFLSDTRTGAEVQVLLLKPLIEHLALEATHRRHDNQPQSSSRRSKKP